MKIRLAVAASVVAYSLTACAPQEDAGESARTWVGTITTEGNVTTVVNESGSVWGGNARLVEQASIGVDVGADEYMLGSVMDVYASADRIIYVIDAQVPVVRMYDYDGRYVGDLGRAGQGPGEYTYPYSITGSPDGRIYVFDAVGGRVNVYTGDGVSLETWQGREGFWSIVAGDDGAVWIDANDPSFDNARSIQTFTDGELGELWHLVNDAGQTVATTGSPSDFRWALGGKARVIVGRGDRYRYTVQERGEPLLVVERFWKPIAVAAEHRAWDSATSSRGPGLGEVQPSFDGFQMAASGEVWISRSGESVRHEDCEEDISAPRRARADPCWTSTPILDVFAADGRYLGEIDAPPRMSRLFVRGDVVIGVVQDDAGVVRVRRYRLVLPREGS